MCLCVCTCIHVTKINEKKKKEATDLKESKKAIMGSFEGRKGKRKMVIIIL